MIGSPVINMKTKINRLNIAKLNPCKDRLDNFVKFYGDRLFTKGQFMGLKNITQKDKLWVAFRSMSTKNIKLAAADIAESVLYIYESKFPNDDRPRKAIEAARRNTSSAYVAAFDAANTTADLAASLTAYAAAYAAAADATDAADYATTTAVYAANAAAKNQNAKLIQEKLIRKIILKYWK